MHWTLNFEYFYFLFFAQNDTFKHKNDQSNVTAIVYCLTSIDVFVFT